MNRSTQQTEQSESGLRIKRSVFSTSIPVRRWAWCVVLQLIELPWHGNFDTDHDVHATTRIEAHNSSLLNTSINLQKRWSYGYETNDATMQHAVHALYNMAGGPKTSPRRSL